MSKFWPGTNIVKSKNNDFTWRHKPAIELGRKDQNNTVQSVHNSRDGAAKKIAALEKKRV